MLIAPGTRYRYESRGYVTGCDGTRPWEMPGDDEDDADGSVHWVSGPEPPLPERWIGHDRDRVYVDNTGQTVTIMADDAACRCRARLARPASARLVRAGELLVPARTRRKPTPL